MMHARHAIIAEDEDGAYGVEQSPRRRTSGVNRTKPHLKKESLHGSMHSENTENTPSKRRSGVASHKSHSSQSSRTGDDFGRGSHRAHASYNSHSPQNFHSSGQLHGSHQFNNSFQSFQNFHQPSARSGSSVSSRHSHVSAGDYVPSTPAQTSQRGNSRRKPSVTSTPRKSSNKSNPQTPPATSSPMKRNMPRRKVADDSHGTTERSSSTRTSYVNSSMGGSNHRRVNGDHHHYSSDDGNMEGGRPRSSMVKKRRPKAPGEVSPNRKQSAVVMSPNTPQHRRNQPTDRDSSHGAGSPGRSNVKRSVKKRGPRRPGDPDSPRRSSSEEDFQDHFYAATDDLGNITTDDDEYQAAPRRSPKRRPKKKAGASMQGSSRDQQGFDEVPETPIAQRSVPSQIGRTPVRSASLVSTSDEELRIAPSRRTSFDTMFTHSSIPNGSATTKLYEHARRCQWDEVMTEVEKNPRDAKTVGEKDGTTALHLAVMSRTNPMMRDGRVGEFKPAPLELIEMLVKACPEAGSTRCTRKRYTPLAYACLVADHGYDMDDCSEMVLILLRHAPGSVYVFTDDGFSAVDIHILSYSQIHKQKEEVYSGGRTSTVVLRTLLAEQPDLAESRIYKHKVRGPIELLYRCNTTEFQDAMIDDLTGESTDVKKKQLKSRFGSVASVLSDWWAWKWVLLLLKFSTIKDKKPGTIFSAVQAAARLVACPLPILALAINTFPHQVEERDPRGELYNLPLHEVCSWRADEAILSGDPFVAGRKLKAIQLLLNEYPEAARMTNNMGETPLQLAVESCTPWHGGLELLVESCPKALKFPRKLRMGDQGLCLSVLNPSALDSVASYDSDEEDPMAAMEGMYPFALAAVLGGVAANKRRIPLDFTEEQKAQHIQQLAQKDLQAVRSVFGLLRSRPDVLEKYRKDVTRDYLRMLKEMEND